MKKALLFAGLTAAAFTLNSCNRSEFDVETPVTRNVTIHVSTDDTKTANDNLNTVWTADDLLTVFVSPAGHDDAFGSNIQFSYVDENCFSGEVTLTKAENDWYVIYPYNSNYTTPANTTCYTAIGSTASSAQTQVGNNSMAHLSGPAVPLYGQAMNVSEEQEPAIQMHQLASVVAVKVLNYTDGPISISKVSLTAPVDIVGTYYIDFFTYPAEYTASGEKYVSNTADLFVSNGEEIPFDGEAIFYLAVKPFEAAAGQTLSLTIAGSNGKVTTDKVLTSAVNFAAGHIKTLTIVYDKAASPEIEGGWELVTSESGLVGGDEIVITNADATKALSVTQNNNNRAAEDVTCSESLHTIAVDPAVHQVITLEEDEGSNYYLQVGEDAYLYAASSSSNHLKTGSKLTVGDNGIFSIEYVEGHPVIKAQGTNKRNWLRYNATSGIFSCYESGQGEIAIYRNPAIEIKPALAAPTDLVAEVVDGNSIHCSWTDVDGVDTYVASATPKGGDPIEIRDILDPVCTFTDLAYETEYTIRVVALPMDPDSYRESAPAKVTVVTDENPIEQLATPTRVKAELVGLNSIAVSWDEVKDADTYIVTATAATGSVTSKDGIKETEYTIVDLAFSTEYSISVVAVPAEDDEYHRNSDPGYATNNVTTGESVSPDAWNLYCGEPVEGYYLLVTSGRAMKASIKSNRFEYSEVTLNGNSIDESAKAVEQETIWYLAPDKTGAGWTIYSPDVELFAASTGTKNQGALVAEGTDEKALWTITDISKTALSYYDVVNVYNQANEINCHLRGNGTNGFATYSDQTGGPISLYAPGENVVIVIKTLPGILWSEEKATVTIGSDENEFPVLYNDNHVAVTYASSNEDVASINSKGEITLVGAGTAVISAIFEGDETYKAQTASYSLTVVEQASPESSTLADVFAGGPGEKKYNLEGLIVNMVNGKTAILGEADSSNKIVLYMENELKMGYQIDIADATVSEYKSNQDDELGLLEITAGTITITSYGVQSFSLGMTLDLDMSQEYEILTAMYAQYAAESAYPIPVNVLMKGQQSGRNITGTNAQLRLSANNAETDGMNVSVKGFIYGYSSKYSNYLFVAESIEAETDGPSLTVKPDALSWKADEFGAEKAKTFTITVEAEGSYTITGVDENWTISDNEGEVTVYPNAENTDEENDKTCTLVITNGADAELTKEVVLTQAKAGAPVVGVSTIADVLAGGPGEKKYNLEGLLVNHVDGKLVILGEEDGETYDKIALYMVDHGLIENDQINITEATVTEYNGYLEITGGEIELVAHNVSMNIGLQYELDTEWGVQQLASQFQNLSEGTYPSPQLVIMSGAQSGRYITGGLGVKLYLNTANDATDGKNVTTMGYVLGYNSKYSNYNYTAMRLEEDATAPALSVTHTALSWSATEYGEGNAKTFAIEVNQGGSYTISGATSDWTVSDDEGTVTVYPNAENTDTENAKKLTLTITHDANNNLVKEVTLTQSKAAGGTGAPSPDGFPFPEMGYSNNQDMTAAAVVGENCTITFNKGTNSNGPKYYDSGTAVRVYGGNFFTVSSTTATISQIELTFGSGDGTNEITTDLETYENGIWTGSSDSVTFTVGGTKGNRRIVAIKVVYE